MARNFETDFKLTLAAARRTLAKHPPLAVTGYLTSPYGQHCAPLALMMRGLYPEAPYEWADIAQGMATGRNTLDEALDELARELKKPEKQAVFEEFWDFRRSMCA